MSLCTRAASKYQASKNYSNSDSSLDLVIDNRGSASENSHVK